MGYVINVLDKSTGKYVSIPALRGASNYELAVQNGFTGTLAEWLESLKSTEADVDLSEYATIDYVDKAIENIDISGANIDLSGVATEDWTKNFINENLETISNGFYESTSLKGEDITDDIIAVNGELPVLPTYLGGTKYIVNGGVTNILINSNADTATFYINDYKTMDVNQKFEINETVDGVAPDYFVYGAYNKDLLSKTDEVEYAKTMINQYVNFNTSDQYFPSTDDTRRLLCGWAFYGREELDNDDWVNKHIGLGTVSQGVQDKIDSLPNAISGNKYSDGTPGQGYRKYPALVIPIKPYTTYTINYTGATDGEEAYLNGLHYCITVDDDLSGGGCNSQAIHHVKHLVGEYTSTFTTGENAKYLILSVSRIKKTSATIDGIGYTMTTDSSVNMDIDVLAYIINHMSVVEGAQTYEYYIDMIKDIDFTLNITAMSMADETVYSYFNIKIPYIMKSNQYFRFNREKEIFTVSRPLVKAVGMQIDSINDNYLNYKANEIGVIGRWIDNKDIYRTVIKVTLPKNASTSTSTILKTSITLPDTIDTLTDIKATLILPNHGGTTPRIFLGNSYAYITTNSNYLHQNFRVSVETTLPNDEAVSFYSALNIEYGGFYGGEDVAIVLEYTKYDYAEDGTII